MVVVCFQIYAQRLQVWTGSAQDSEKTQAEGLIMLKIEMFKMVGTGQKVFRKVIGSDFPAVDELQRLQSFGKKTEQGVVCNGGGFDRQILQLGKNVDGMGKLADQEVFEAFILLDNRWPVMQGH